MTTRAQPQERVRVTILRDRGNDHTEAAARVRRESAPERMGVTPEHVGRCSFDPALTRGSVEHFMGVAEVPLGLAGPLLVNGEQAHGEFYVPMATAERTLVASYNRGMRLLFEAGGVTTTVMDDRMPRAPVLLFRNARGARAFDAWLDERFDDIKAAAATTTCIGRLQDIERYSAGRMLYTRFNYTSRDAAGQNLTGKATQAASQWMLAHSPSIEH